MKGELVSSVGIMLDRKTVKGLKCFDVAALEQVWLIDCEKRKTGESKREKETEEGTERKENLLS